MSLPTIRPGVIEVASAFPDPPFDIAGAGGPGGFDEELMQAIATHLGYAWRLTRFTGANFNDIFDGLAAGTLDAVISGTTITPSRAARVLFSAPYLTFNQGLAVNAARTPAIVSVAGLKGATVGIQIGNTSDIVARRLLAEGGIAAIRYYPYDGIAEALDDLAAGTIGGVIKLHPVIAWLVRGRPSLKVIAEFPTHEQLGIAFAKDNVALRDKVDSALAALRADGTFGRLVDRWIPPGMAAA